MGKVGLVFFCARCKIWHKFHTHIGRIHVYLEGNEFALQIYNRLTSKPFEE